MNDKTDYSVDRTKRSPQLDVTSKEIDGISDLVVWAPIREGFIDAFNNVTYESRLRLVAEALHSLRKTAREFEKLEAFADTAKRIISLLDFRIGIVDRDLMGVADDPGNGTPRTFQSQKFMYLVANI